MPFQISFDVSEYPIVYIVDKKSESVLVFNAEKQEFLRKIRLQLPEDKAIRFMGAKFKKLPDGFLVELVSSAHDTYHPDFYRASGNQVYFYDNEGTVKGSTQEYPEEYRTLSGSSKPVSYLTMGDFGNDIILSFPHSRKLSFHLAS